MRKAVYNKIIFRLTAPIVAIVILVFAVLLPVMVHVSKSFMEDSLHQQLTHLSNAINDYVNKDAEDLMHSLRLLIDIPGVDTALQEHRVKELEEVLLPVKRSLTLDFIAVIDHHGAEVFISSPEMREKELVSLDIIKEGLNGLNLSTVRLIGEKLYSIGMVSTNVWERPILIVAGRTLRKPLSMDVEESLKDYEIVLYDADGKVALSTGANQWAHESLTPDVLSRIYSSEEPFFRKIMHADSHEHIVMYSPLKSEGSINTICSIHIPASAILTAQNKVISTILIFLFAGIFLMIVASYVTTSWVSRRIGKLLKGTREIAEGKLGYQLPEPYNDELAEVTNSFNEMSRSLITSHEWWHETFDSMSDAVTIHDVHGNIVKANASAGKLIGLPAHELVGKKCYETFHNSSHQISDCPLKNTTVSQKPEEIDIFNEILGRWLSISTSPVFDKDGKLSSIIHVTRDISERKYTDTLVEHQYNRLKVLHSIEKAVNSNIELHETMSLLAEQVTDQLGLDAASVLIYNHKTERLEYEVSKGFRSSALKFTKLKIGEGLAGRAAKEKHVVSIQNLTNERDLFVRSEQFKEEGFVSYFAVPLIAKGEVRGVLELFNRSALNATYAWLDFLETIADQAATAINNAVLFNELEKSRNELALAYESIIFGWSLALDMRDRETEGHSKRVTVMTIQIAQEMGVKDIELAHIRRGALLHDIGKMGIPDSILLKPGRLTESERNVMEQHPVFAYDLMSEIDYLKAAMDIPYYHHEKWDGTGYPKGLAGEDIPLSARIFAVVDVWDALSSDRPYRLAWRDEKVIEYIRSESGKHFDPDVVKVFLNILMQENEDRGEK